MNGQSGFFSWIKKPCEFFLSKEREFSFAEMRNNYYNFITYRLSSIIDGVNLINR